MKILNFLRAHLLFTSIILLGFISLIFGILIFGNSDWGDWYYINVFSPLNKNLQSVLKFSEVPFYMVTGIIAFVILIGQILSSSGNPLRNILISWLLFISSSFIFLVCLFYWMWGFNYGRTTISESYFMDNYISMDTTALKNRWKLQTKRVNHLRKQFVMPDSGTTRLTTNYVERYQKTAGNLGFFFSLDSSLHPLCKEFRPAGMLLRLNTAGFYFPYGSESYVDEALHVSQKPFVIAHEMSHGFGVTDEGEANFVGYILCQSSGDPLARYSSALALWLYMASDCRHLSSSFGKATWDSLSPEVWADLQARRALDEKFPEFMPRMRNAIYNSYLTMNKVEGGLNSYNRFVKMVLTYEKMKKQK